MASAQNYLVAGRVSAEVKCEAPDLTDPRTQLMLGAYIPGLAECELPSRPADIALAHHESPRAVLERNGCRLTLFDEWHGRISPDLYHLLYGVSRVKLMEQGVYCVHAAAVGHDDQLLLVGHSGSGKTTTALTLLREDEWKLGSGNKSAIEFDPRGGLQLISGTASMTVRADNGAAFAEDFGSTMVAYGERLAFSIDQQHLVASGAHPIRGIVLVRVLDGVRDARQMSGLSALHTLYPYFMDAANADVLVCGGKQIFRGTAPEGAAEQLASKLHATIQTLPVYSVSGSLSFISGTVKDIWAGLPRR